METIRVSDDLIIEVHDGDPPALHLVSELASADSEDYTAIIVWPSEIRALRDALIEAAGVCVAMQTYRHEKAGIEGGDVIER